MSLSDTTLVRQNLAIPEERMPEGEVVTYGRVRRAGSGNESTSPPQIILIKTTRPGGTDTDPGSPWHTGLEMEVEGLPEGATLQLGKMSGLGLVLPDLPVRTHPQERCDRIVLGWHFC